MARHEESFAFWLLQKAPASTTHLTRSNKVGASFPTSPAEGVRLTVSPQANRPDILTIMPNGHPMYQCSNVYSYDQNIITRPASSGPRYSLSSSLPSSVLTLSARSAQPVVISLRMLTACSLKRGFNAQCGSRTCIVLWA